MAVDYATGLLVNGSPYRLLGATPDIGSSSNRLGTIFNQKLDAGIAGDGNVAVRFNIARAWRFRQAGSGGNTKLVLEPEVNTKTFVIQDLSGKVVAEFRSSNTSPAWLGLPTGGTAVFGPNTTGGVGFFRVGVPDSDKVAIAVTQHTTTPNDYLRGFDFGGNTKLRLKSDGSVFLANASTPATPSGGGILFVDSGALKYIGSSGTTTTIAIA